MNDTAATADRTQLQDHRRCRLMPFLNSSAETAQEWDYFTSPMACSHSSRATTLTENTQMTSEESRTTEGIIRAIEWLRQAGRPILAAKMERELLATLERPHLEAGTMAAFSLERVTPS